MSVTLSERWAETDKPIYFVHNFTDVRAGIDVKVNNLPITAEQFANDTTINFPKDWVLGSNVLYEHNDVREFHFIVNGKQPVAEQVTDSRKLSFVAHRCKVNCFPPPPPKASCQFADIRKWSDSKSWDYTELEPTEESIEEGYTIYREAKDREDSPFWGEADSFIIPFGWNVEFDLEEPSPIFDTIEINGCLHFKNEKDADLHLRAKKILIRGGELYIGSYEKKGQDEYVWGNKPFEGKAKITLSGNRNEPTLAIQDQGIEAGSKIIANLGRLNI
jgi:hypothetical protein